MPYALQARSLSTPKSHTPGIKDSPPFLRDAQLLTLAATVEFSNLGLGRQAHTAGKRRPRRLFAVPCVETAMRLFTGTVLLMLLASPLYAQKGNPAFTEPETRQAAAGTPAAHETNAQDRLFAELAAMSGLAERETCCRPDARP
jgi:hypothetical protein